MINTPYLVQTMSIGVQHGICSIPAHLPMSLLGMVTLYHYGVQVGVRVYLAIFLGHALILLFIFVAPTSCINIWYVLSPFTQLCSTMCMWKCATALFHQNFDWNSTEDRMQAARTQGRYLLPPDLIPDYPFEKVAFLIAFLAPPLLMSWGSLPLQLSIFSYVNPFTYLIPYTLTSWLSHFGIGIGVVSSLRLLRQRTDIQDEIRFSEGLRDLCRTSMLTVAFIMNTQSTIRSLAQLPFAASAIAVRPIWAEEKLDAHIEGCVEDLEESYRLDQSPGGGAWQPEPYKYFGMTCCL